MGVLVQVYEDEMYMVKRWPQCYDGDTERPVNVVFINADPDYKGRGIALGVTTLPSWVALTVNKETTT